MKKIHQLSEAAFQLEGKMPLSQAIPLGLQHVLAMFVGNLTPLLIITSACGISGGVMCDGLGSSFAALFGVLPNTSFSQTDRTHFNYAAIYLRRCCCHDVFFYCCQWNSINHQRTFNGT